MASIQNKACFLHLVTIILVTPISFWTVSAAGMTLRTDCLEDSRLTCFWGCSVQKLYEALQKHVYCFRISTPQALEEALYSDYLHREQYLYPFPRGSRCTESETGYSKMSPSYGLFKICFFFWQFAFTYSQVLKNTAKKNYIANYRAILKLTTLVQCPDLVIHW